MKTHADEPWVAYTEEKGKKVVRAVGREALKMNEDKNSGIKLINGFDHPRIIISDFEAADFALRYFIRHSMSEKPLIRPRMIIHPQREFEDGLAEVEFFLLRELAQAAGAREVFIWTGYELSDAEIKTLNIDTEGIKLSMRFDGRV